ncbi:D-hexose-6-phosphate mutarotase [Pasteurellaceae bacterium Pebbles2]|nr:D-hexose-6-phosphate mutarotase [Pasteurellaceae bacterium Pebbles2]
MNIELIKQISNGLALYHYNEIPVVELTHAVGSAKIALQGAQLLSWKPQNTNQDVFWLSEIEPFKQGSAIRGGVPICFPWFANVKEPMHGFARIKLWDLAEYQITDEQVALTFLLQENDIKIAKIEMLFSKECELIFTNYHQENAQLALHSYFNIGDIEQTVLHNLPTKTFDKLTNQYETVPSPRIIRENVDCIYSAEKSPTLIEDQANQRTIEIEHINASDIVVWNPWHKPTGSMTETAYKTMVCVETGRINQFLDDQPVRVKIRVK